MADAVDKIEKLRRIFYITMGFFFTGFFVVAVLSSYLGDDTVDRFLWGIAKFLGY